MIPNFDIHFLKNEVLILQRCCWCRNKPAQNLVSKQHVGKKYQIQNKETSLVKKRRNPEVYEVGQRDERQRKRLLWPEGWR